MNFEVFYCRSLGYFGVGDRNKGVSTMNFSFVDYTLFQAKKLKKKM